MNVEPVGLSHLVKLDQAGVNIVLAFKHALDIDHVIELPVIKLRIAARLVKIGGLS